MTNWENGWAEYGYDNASHEERLMFRLGYNAALERMKVFSIENWLQLIPDGWLIIEDTALTRESSYIIHKNESSGS